MHAAFHLALDDVRGCGRMPMVVPRSWRLLRLMDMLPEEIAELPGRSTYPTTRRPLASAFSSFAKRLWRGLSDFWPHGPLALLVLAGGLANVLTGLWAEGVQALPGLRAGLPALSEHMSLGALGSSAQVVLGAGLILVGVGLLWRLRVAWSFALLLLLITIAVNVARGDYGTSLVLPSLVFVGLLLTQGSFTRSTLLGSSIASLVSVAAVMAYGTFGAFLLGADFEPVIDDLTGGLCFTVVTLSTVGYGDIHPATAQTQLFVVSLVVVGLSVFATAVVSIIGPALSGRLSRFFIPEQRMKLRDHIILVGEGAIARNTARVLAVASTPRSIRRLKRAGADLVFAPAAAGTAS